MIALLAIKQLDAQMRSMLEVETFGGEIFIG